MLLELGVTTRSLVVILLKCFQSDLCLIINIATYPIKVRLRCHDQVHTHYPTTVCNQLQVSNYKRVERERV